MFEVGKKVICIVPLKSLGVKLGDVFELLQIKKSQCKCNDLDLDIGFTAPQGRTYRIVCGACTVKYNLGSDGIHWVSSLNFAPYDDSLSDITSEELLEEIEQHTLVN